MGHQWVEELLLWPRWQFFINDSSDSDRSDGHCPLRAQGMPGPVLGFSK